MRLKQTVMAQVKCSTHVMARIYLIGVSIAVGVNAPQPSLCADEAVSPLVVGDTGSALTAKEADALIAYHNTARKSVGVGPIKWSPTVAKFAQEWANEVARTGKLQHRPHEGEWRQRYGENMAWGMGGGYGVLTGAKYWYDEIKFYAPGASMPEDIGGFKAAHYTQMVWKDTTEIGAGKAIIQKGERQGWLVVVCNYNPRGNIAGKKPY